MDRSERNKYRQRLHELGRRLDANVNDLKAEGLRTTGGAASGNLSNAPLHLADLGSDQFEQELTLALLETGQFRLGEIADALDRVEHGTFGICEDCGQEISKGRLDAIPYTRLCIQCASRNPMTAPAVPSPSRP
jgi:RNA polymerase-binding transcription factor DksA